MSSTWGKNIRISVFGESHGKAIGVTVDGLPAGTRIDTDKLEKEMARRAPRKTVGSTARTEADKVIFLSGVLDNVLTGAPVCMMIENSNMHSGDYGNILTKPRPSHADYTGNLRYDGFNDIRGGGHFSGRLTAPLVAVGAICKQILENDGVIIGSHILKIGKAEDESFDKCNISKETLLENSDFPFGVKNEKVREQYETEIEEARKNCDSIGGIIECAAVGIKAGIGSPMFDGLENRISSLTFGIPAVKGIEFGRGFEFANLHGSECNDEMYYGENGTVKTYTNNNGGILGGISNGMPIVYRVAIKPTASIFKEQKTVDLEAKENTLLTIKGRHDSCIAVRAVPVVEATCAIALLDAFLDK